jgi:O-antigen/teichoic acid export membrane protein
VEGIRRVSTRSPSGLTANAGFRPAVAAFYRYVLRSDFVRKVAGTYATRLGVIALGLVTSVLITRHLGPEGRGLFAAALTLGTIGAQLGNLGLHAANTYSVARDRALLGTLLGNSLVVGLGIAGVGALLAWMAFTAWPQAAPVSGILLAVGLLAVPLHVTHTHLNALLLGLQEVRTINWTHLGERILATVLIVALVLTGFVMPETVLVLFVSTSVLAIAVLYVRIRTYPASRARASWETLKGCLSYGVRAYIAALFAHLVIKSDILMVQYFLGPEQVGYYSLAAVLSEQMYNFAAIVGMIVFAKLSALEDSAHKLRLVERTVLGLAGIMLVGGLLAAVLADYVIVLLYGEAFRPAVRLFLVLIPAVFALSLNTMFQNYFASVGFPLIAVVSPIAGALLNLGLNAILLPSIGVIGASLSSIAAYALMLLCSLFYVYVLGRRKPVQAGEGSK